jgi:hypothetical protein
MAGSGTLLMVSHRGMVPHEEDAGGAKGGHCAGAGTTGPQSTQRFCPPLARGAGRRAPARRGAAGAGGQSVQARRPLGAVQVHEGRPMLRRACLRAERRGTSTVRS